MTSDIPQSSHLAVLYPSKGRPKSAPIREIIERDLIETLGITLVSVLLWLKFMVSETFVKNGYRVRCNGTKIHSNEICSATVEAFKKE